MRTILRFVFAVIIVTTTFSARAEIVIVNPLQSESSLSIASVRAIFFMRLTQWKDHSPITVYVLRTREPIHTRFCESVLGVFPYQLQRAWDRLVFSGTGQSPTFVDSLTEMKRRIAMTPGSIGYISEDALDGTVKAIELR